MPVVDHSTYCRMLDEANKGRYAFPAINVSSMSTANAALAGLAAEGSDGFLQVSTGAGQFASGLHNKDSVLGAIALADAIHTLAEAYDIGVALHTDHCLPDKVDSFLIPLIEETERRRARGQKNLFNSHMFDGSILPLEANLRQSQELLERCARAISCSRLRSALSAVKRMAWITGACGEALHDPRRHACDARGALADRWAVHARSDLWQCARRLQAGHVVLRPDILKQGQDAVLDRYGADARFDLVFHGGSGSDLSDIHETLDYGVIEMNVDTDTQYAFASGHGSPDDQLRGRAED